MNIPTQEQYNAAKNNIDHFCHALRMSRTEQARLIEMLYEEQKIEKTYLKAIEENREIIYRFEIAE